MDYNDEAERVLARATRSQTPEEMYRDRIRQIAQAMQEAADRPCIVKPRRSKQGR